MARFILQPGESRQMPLTGRFLVARKVIGSIVVSDTELGIPEFVVKQSDNVELERSRAIVVKNVGDTEADIDLQSSPVRIWSNDGGSVQIAGGSIDSILDPITVEATAVVENGTVFALSPTTNGQGADIVIAPGNSAVILPADPTAKRRVAIVQNISAEIVAVRVGADPAAATGAYLAGGVDAVASLEFETTGELKAFNAGLTSATICVMWGKV